MDKTQNNAAWLLVLPVFVIVAFSAIIPLMTVVNYAFQDILGPEDRVWVGTEWFRQVLSDSDLHGAALRQLVFSLTILVIQIPLGIAVCLVGLGLVERDGVLVVVGLVIGMAGLAANFGFAYAIFSVIETLFFGKHATLQNVHPGVMAG